MKDIWILQKEIFEGFIYQSSLEIKDYLEELGVTIDIYDYRAFKFDIVDGKEILYYKNQEVIDLPKVVFARGNCYKLMHYLNSRGVKIINGFMNMVHMKDKWQTYLNLKEKNILQPRTINSREKLDYTEVTNMLGSPFIVKYRFGAQGSGVYLVHNNDEYEEAISKYYFDDLILQEYISTSYGKDIRVFVVGEDIYGVVRDNSANDFRANLAQGGVSYKFDIPDSLKNTIKVISKEIEAEIVGLDFLFCGDEYTFCEANGNAGYKAFIAQDIDMSKNISNYIWNKYFKG